MVTGAELLETGLLQLLVASPLQAEALADRNERGDEKHEDGCVH